MGKNISIGFLEDFQNKTRRIFEGITEGFSKEISGEFSKIVFNLNWESFVEFPKLALEYLFFLKKF